MKAILKLTSTLALLIFITACGGGGGSKPPSEQIDAAVWDQGNWNNINWQ